jgi:hypothetical protein
MTDRTERYVVLPLLGAVAFWVPDTLVHLVRSTHFDSPDVVVVTVLMPLSLFGGWFIVSRTRRRSMSSTAIPFLCGIWLTGGLFMSLGWVLKVSDPASSVWLSTLLGIVPIYTFMAATYDGSLFALLLISVVLFTAWLLPLARGKVQLS